MVLVRRLHLTGDDAEELRPVPEEDELVDAEDDEGEELVEDEVAHQPAQKKKKKKSATRRDFFLKLENIYVVYSILMTRSTTRLKPNLSRR